MSNSKNAAGFIAYHGKILLRGLVKALYGAAVTGLFGLAAYGFLMIPKEGGYVAVCEFVGAVATMVLAFCCAYSFGGRKKRTGRFSYNG